MSKPRPFTKLEKRIEELFEPKLNLKFRCHSYPIRSQWGSSSIPRFYLKLDKEIIWDFPKDFEVKEIQFYQWMDDNKISQLVRAYVDTPVAELLEKEFEIEKPSFIANFKDKDSTEVNIDYKLTELFKAADRRLGKEKLFKWAKKKDNPNPKVCLILKKRFGKDYTIQLSFKELAILGAEQLSKQGPVTLEMARAQVARIHARRSSNDNRMK